jgi:hypothetical protein
VATEMQTCTKLMKKDGRMGGTMRSNFWGAWQENDDREYHRWGDVGKHGWKKKNTIMKIIWTQ